MAPSRQLRILLLVQGKLEDRMSGPEIRGWEMAKVLAQRHRVTVAARDQADATREGIRLINSARRRLVREAPRHDVVIGPTVPPYLFAALVGRPTLTITDLYDPVELELGTLASKPGTAAKIETTRAVTRLQLSFSDVLLCGGERQRERLMEELQALRRNNGSGPVVRTVPFGLSADPPPTLERPLRERFPGIEASDTVILWWGSIWKWLDAETAIHAFERLARDRPDVKLVFAVGRARTSERQAMAGTEGARSLADSLQLLDRQVFFLEEWIPYDERHRYLKDADIGLTLHRDTPEARLAVRARYMDYLWTSLPCVLARGDEVAARFGDAGFAAVVPPKDPEQACSALSRLVDESDALAQAQVAGRALAESYRWPATIAPLLEVLDEVAESNLIRRPGRVAVLPKVGAFYARRAAQKAAVQLMRHDNGAGKS